MKAVVEFIIILVPFFLFVFARRWWLRAFRLKASSYQAKWPVDAGLAIMFLGVVIGFTLVKMIPWFSIDLATILTVVACMAGAFVLGPAAIQEFRANNESD